MAREARHNRLPLDRGRSSGVEHNLAKVRVGRSIRLARSKFPSYFKCLLVAQGIGFLGICLRVPLELLSGRVFALGIALTSHH